MNIGKSVDVLRVLIEVNNKSIAGYDAAIKETGEADLKTLFAQFKHKSQACKAALIGEVHKLNKTPVNGPEPAGTSHRAWLDYKGPLTGKDRLAVLHACEYTEKVAAQAYAEALENNLKDLTTEQQTMLSGQHTLIKSNLEALKSLQERP